MRFSVITTLTIKNRIAKQKPMTRYSKALDDSLKHLYPLSTQPTAKNNKPAGSRTISTDCNILTCGSIVTAPQDTAKISA